VWDTTAGRLNFAAFSRRIVAGHRVAAVAIQHPAHFVAFDLLAVGGKDLRRRPLATRREQLEQLMSGLAAPLAVCEQTTEEAVARGWLETLGAAGVEGVVVKDRAAAYPDGARMRCWYKVKIRNSLDAVAVGMVGDPAAPTALLLACPTADGLRPMGTTTALPRATARDVGRHLVVDPQVRPHRVSWPGREVSEARLTGVEPVVVEVSADVAIDSGVLGMRRGWCGFGRIFRWRTSPGRTEPVSGPCRTGSRGQGELEWPVRLVGQRLNQLRAVGVHPVHLA
jgi:ATP-dependent DNA ligase